MIGELGLSFSYFRRSRDVAAWVGVVFFSQHRASACFERNLLSPSVVLGWMHVVRSPGYNSVKRNECTTIVINVINFIRTCDHLSSSSPSP